MKGDVILNVSGLVAAFGTESGTLVAVDRAGFELKQGRTLGIVGESGCGKSVTALCVMRLLPRPSGRIQEGSIRFDGIDLLSLPLDAMQSIRGKRIAMIFQEPMTALNPVHRIGRQIKEVYGLHFPEMTAKAMTDAAMTMLDRVGIADSAGAMKAYAHQLSGGMRQRVMIAMALASKPDILIADEPTTALDVTVQAQILELIRELQKETGMSMILITHDLGVIAENCDDTVVMYGGQVVEKAPVALLFKNPCHPYTRGLLASIPANAAAVKSILPTIAGMVPSLEDMPQGCRFSTRCPIAREICSQIFPAQRKVGDGHFAFCHFLDRECC
ncbi:MAG: ABC transporter ATP-binding protein [Pseudomonadota bacterium]